MAASAGTSEFLDDENFEIIEVGEEVPEEADFGLALNGDSMEPRYHDNQAVWVQQTNSLSSGEIGIFYLDGMTYCKQLKDNKDGYTSYILIANMNLLRLLTKAPLRFLVGF